MEYDSISIRDRLYDICNMRLFAKQLLGKGKVYDQLLKTILSKDYAYNYDIETPNIKKFAELSGLSYDKVRKQISLIYNDLVNHEETGVKISIKKVKYIFHLRYFDYYASITFDSLPNVPRVGETIEISYFKEKVKTSQFYVAEIRHRITDKLQEISIICKGGKYNCYWQWRKDQAISQGEISMHDYFFQEDSKLKKTLGLYD
jgi:hypothetical protein